jgi:hypothetical protein
LEVGGSRSEVQCPGFDVGRREEANWEEGVAGIKRFEDIQAWQEARELTRMVYDTSDEDEEPDRRVYPLPGEKAQNPASDIGHRT